MTSSRLAELGGEQFVLFDRASSYHELTQAMFLEAGIAPPGVMELDNVDSAKKMVELGLGVAFLPRVAVADEVQADACASSSSQTGSAAAPPDRRRAAKGRGRSARRDGGVPRAAARDRPELQAAASATARSYPRLSLTRMAAAPYRRTFGRLLGFLRPYKWSLVVSIVLAVLSQAAQFATAFLTGAGARERGRGTRQARAQADRRRGPRRRASRARCSWSARRLISGQQALGVEFDMRSALYAHLLRLSFGFYDRHQTGQLMSRATVDLQTVRFFLGYGLIFFFQNVLTLVGAAVVMFFVNWKLTLVALWIAPLLIGLAYRYSHVAHPLLRDVQQKMADVATVAEENIVGVHVVKSFAQEQAEQAKFERSSEARLRAERRGEHAARALRAAALVPAAARAGGRDPRRRADGDRRHAHRTARSSRSTSSC